MQKIWQVSPKQAEAAQSLGRQLNLSAVLSQVLINRGITAPAAAESYLNATMADCHDPFRLKGMQPAVSRIRRALDRREPIVIYGDYDVDGVTSTALLVDVLQAMGGTVRGYIPHRLEEGYGLNQAACASLAEQGTGLIITVDCGIGARQEVEFCLSRGVEVIVTDHHRPQPELLPQEVPIINPLQPGCEYPYKSLAGVGIAYKLAVALCGGPAMEKHLDLVALGTISDVAPLTGENRILVKYGLSRLSRTEKPGIRALIAVAGIRTRNLSASHVGFMLGPRLNATGRMGSADVALRLLLCADQPVAVELAQSLNAENRERQRLEAKTLKEALALVEREINLTEHRSVVLHHDSWHPGVIGIVASRLAERFNRPTILISTAEDLGRGSGRSIRNFHLFDALHDCRHLLETFGGHAKAAGMSIVRDNLSGFKTLFNEMACRSLSERDLIPVLDADMEVPLAVLEPGFLREMDRCAPFGMGNPQPLFISRGLRIKSTPRPQRSYGLRFWVTDGRQTCSATWSRPSTEAAQRLPERCDLLYSPSLNEWQGIETIQLQAKDMQAASPVDCRT